MTLEQIYKRHKDWVNIVRSLGGADYSEDIVQEMYIKLDKYIKQGTLKKRTYEAYVYFTLRSITLDIYRAKKGKHKTDIDDCVNLCEEDIQGFEEFDYICEKANNEIHRWHWYDQELFKLFMSGKSMREIARNTHISLSSIFHTIKICKERIANEIGEDYEDYLNGDYEKI